MALKHLPPTVCTNVVRELLRLSCSPMNRRCFLILLYFYFHFLVLFNEDNTYSTEEKERESALRLCTLQCALPCFVLLHTQVVPFQLSLAETLLTFARISPVPEFPFMPRISTIIQFSYGEGKKIMLFIYIEKMSFVDIEIWKILRLFPAWQ